MAKTRVDLGNVKGPKGDDGATITAITKNAEQSTGLVDHYDIELSDGQKYEDAFTVTNGTGSVSAVNPEHLLLNEGTLDLSSQVTQKLSEVDTSLSNGYLHTKNLFDKYNLVLNKSFGSTGALESSKAIAIGYIKVEGNKTYTISQINMRTNNLTNVWLASDKTTVISIATNKNGGSSVGDWEIYPTIVTAPSNAKYLGVSLNNSAEHDEKEVFQVEEGSGASDYQPYVPSNVQIMEELSDMNWKALSSVTGKSSSISIPSNAKELFIKIALNGGESWVATILIPTIVLSSSGVGYNVIASPTVYGRFVLSKTNYVLNASSVDGADKSSVAVTTIYYK